MAIVVSILSAAELFWKSFNTNFYSHIVVDVQMSIVNSFLHTFQLNKSVRLCGYVVILFLLYYNSISVLTFMSCERNEKNSSSSSSNYVYNICESTSQNYLIFDIVLTQNHTHSHTQKATHLCVYTRKCWIKSDQPQKNSTNKQITIKI